jgi:UDP-glucose 4-epimerase
MQLTGKRILLAGGAGFIGSHLAERLVSDNDVIVADNLSNGNREWVPADATFVQTDLRQPDDVAAVLSEDVDLVVHLAADKNAARDDITQFRRNNRLIETVLERMDEVGVDAIAFASSSTVYGEAPRPTPEEYAPLEPISIYGAGKLAEESLLSVYANSHDIEAWVFRFANVVGPRLQAGAVIPDFIEKLEDDPTSLEILGDGSQEKSYLHVDSCVDAMCHIIEHASPAQAPAGQSDDSGNFHVFNLGTRTTTAVTRIAAIVAAEMELDPTFEFTGGERGWTGDVPRMRLAIEKLAAIGWEPTHSSDDAVRRATRELLAKR